MNSVLWGGLYNPIIPAYKKLPPWWKNHPVDRHTARTVAEGYLDAFDPDFVTTFGTYSSPPIDVGPREIIHGLEIVQKLSKEGYAPYGIGIYELLQQLYKEEFRYVTRNPVKLRFISCTGPYSAFIASVFGALPKDIEKTISDHHAKHFDAEFCEIDPLEYTNFLTREYEFPRRLVAANTRLDRDWRNEADRILLMDGTKTSDIIDYWNLRAAGSGVFPVPLEFSDDENVLEAAAQIVESNYYPYRNNPDMYNHTTLQKSRQVSESDLKQFLKSLPIKKTKAKAPPKVVMQTWMPRVWDEWARAKAEGRAASVVSEEKSHDVEPRDGRISFPSLAPDFVGEHNFSGKPAYANNIELRLYGSEDNIAEVIPPGDGTMIRAISGYDPENWRFSSAGPVYLASFDRKISITAPMAEDVMIEWLKSQGWTARLSAPGKIAKQMTKQLGGNYGGMVLKSPGIVSLISELSGGKTISHASLEGRLKQIANTESRFIGHKRLLELLSESKIIQVGLEFPCDSCGQRSWFKLTNVDYSLVCSNCYEPLPITTTTPSESSWAYRCGGPFALPRRSYGAISVVLLQAFLSQNRMNSSTSTLFSFEAQKKGVGELEADLAMLYQSSHWRKTEIETIFAECKSNNRFKREDVDRMRDIAKSFPGSILIFATLNPELTQTEKRLIRPFANMGRRNWKAERPNNPVIVLTGTELLSTWGPPQCWKNAGGDLADFAAKLPRSFIGELLELADMTQQLYLDMSGYSVDGRHARGK